jgi:hypothetical protein
MGPEMTQKLATLRSDYEARVGRPFSHFYCPILFMDEAVDLCKAHIVNANFPDSVRSWTIQRTDVDNFYGSTFESDFVDIQYRGKDVAESILADPRLSKKLRPKIRLGDEDIKYFVASGPVPEHFTETVVLGSDGPVRLGLKIHPDDAMTAMSKKWSIAIEKDIRLPALVSILKAAYLTMFEMLGYSYPLSAGGRLVGWDILGKFFLRNSGLEKTDVIANAEAHFKEFANMVRPLLDPPADVQGTASDRFVFVCRCDTETPWGIIVFIRTSHLVHAALVPILETDSAAERFVTFLRGGDCKIRANRCRFDGDKWYGAKDEEILTWPRAELSGQLDFRGL